MPNARCFSVTDTKCSPSWSHHSDHVLITVSSFDYCVMPTARCWCTDTKCSPSWSHHIMSWSLYQVLVTVRWPLQGVGVTDTKCSPSQSHQIKSWLLYQVLIIVWCPLQGVSVTDTKCSPSWSHPIMSWSLCQIFIIVWCPLQSVGVTDTKCNPSLSQILNPGNGTTSSKSNGDYAKTQFDAQSVIALLIWMFAVLYSR